MLRNLITAGVVLVISASAYSAHDEYSRIEVRGTVHSDRSSEGRSQPYISADGNRYQLDLGDSRALRRFVRRHDGETLTVFGELDARSSSYGGTRLAIDVNRIEHPRGGSVRSNDPDDLEDFPIVREREVRYERERPTIVIPRARLPRVRIR